MLNLSMVEGPCHADFGILDEDICLIYFLKIEVKVSVLLFSYVAIYDMHSKIELKSDFFCLKSVTCFQ